MLHIFPNSSQGPFPKIAGKGLGDFRESTKLLSNLKDLPYELRLKELKLPTLAHRRL